MSTAGGGTFGTTVPLGGGYQCQACHQWVTPGITHYCSPNYYTPAPQVVYTFNYVDLATLIKSIEELKDAVKELKDIVDKQQ